MIEPAWKGKYICIITEFVSGSISPSQFEKTYIEMFKHEQSELPEEVYWALNNLFSDVDAFCEDPGLRDDNDLGERELLESAKNTLEKLKSS